MKICILGDSLCLNSGHSKPAYELSVELIKLGIDIVFLTNELDEEIKRTSLQLAEKYPELKKVDFITIKKFKWSEFEKDKVIKKIESCDYFHFFTPSLSVINKFTDVFPDRVIWQLTSDYLTINDLYKYGRSYLSYFLYSPKKIGNLISKYFYKSVGQKCKTVICTTKYMHVRFLKLGLNSSKVKYIPFGVDINSGAEENKTHDSEGLVYLYFGWLSQARGFTDLQVAFEKVHAELKESQLIVANPGVHLEEEKMLHNIRGSKHFSAIQILPWQKDITEVLEKADVVVLPFRGTFGYSQPPLVVVEAMINSKPVISTNVGCINELVDHERTGLLIEPGNINDLINSMLSFADKRRWINMGKEAGKKIQKNNWQNVIDKYIGLYKK
jgi:glycosyltransferase involved in cell wall biosynthesis